MRLIRLTDLGGNPTWIVDAWVQAIRRPVPGEFQENAHAVIVLSGYTIGVQEGPEMALKEFNGKS